MDLKPIFEKYKSLLLIIPDTWFTKIYVNILRQLQTESVCYVTLNRTHKELLEMFKKSNISPKSFSFIEGAIFVRDKDPDEEIIDMVESPIDLESLASACIEMAKHKKNQIIFVDSLSTLLILNENKEIISFIGKLVEDANEIGIKVIFSILQSDVNSKVVSDSELLIEKIVDLQE